MQWQAWIRSGQLFVIVIIVAALPLFIHLLTHPALLRRRLRSPLAEPDPVQRVIGVLALLCVAALVLVSVDSAAVSHALGPSPPVPIVVMILGDLFVACGLLLVWLVFRANAYAAATVKVEHGQQVVSTGPYAVVRHPLYSGAALLLLGLPVALGSWWGLVPALACIALIVVRLLREERYLSAQLSGYDEYRAKTRRRLIPFIW